MSNKYKDLTREILEKKFIKKLQAGYDPLDVDEFFDKVINEIGNLVTSLEILESNNNKLVKDIENFKKELISREKIIETLNNELNDLKKDGYDSYRTSESIRKLKADVEEMKNKK